MQARKPFFVCLGMVTAFILCADPHAQAFQGFVSTTRAFQISDEIAARELVVFDPAKYTERFGGGYTLVDYTKSITEVTAQGHSLFVIIYDYKKPNLSYGPPQQFQILVYRDTGHVEFLLNR